jgi:hypothetical protein
MGHQQLRRCHLHPPSMASNIPQSYQRCAACQAAVSRKFVFVSSTHYQYTCLQAPKEATLLHVCCDLQPAAARAAAVKLSPHQPALSPAQLPSSQHTPPAGNKRINSGGSSRRTTAVAAASSPSRRPAQVSLSQQAILSTSRFWT